MQVTDPVKQSLVFLDRVVLADRIRTPEPERCHMVVSLDEAANQLACPTCQLDSHTS
jgi:hypothetical protein